MANKLKIFENGSNYLRADFHLHTKADEEFKYDGDPNYFVKNYLDKLEEEEIRIGVITNHNKFDEIEFRELKKNAIKKEIYLLPGVELSINDGRKGLHALIVFKEEWIINMDNNHNYIQQFINGAFSGVANFDKPPYDVNSIYNLKELCLALDRYKKDYFIVLAHVDDSSGLFLELEGRGLSEFLNLDSFKKNVIALQKVRTHRNIGKLNSILDNNVPAFVEGTDCAHKGIEGIGKGNEIDGVTQKTYLKIGDYNFDAVKYALKDYKNRLLAYPVLHSRPYIKSITYVSKRLGDKSVYLSSSMNNLIGIRGSGKSSILESIRYLLDIPLSHSTKDYDYKNNIVQELLGSGGKMSADIIDSQGQVFTVERIFGESANIYLDGMLQQSLKVDSIVSNPLYFGQKDLSELGSEASTDDLIRRLIGNKTIDIKQQLEIKCFEVEDLLREIKKVDATISKEQDLKAKKAELEIKEKAYKQHSVDKKLNRQVEFDKDKSKLAALSTFEEMIISKLRELWTDNSFNLDDYISYKSKENNEIFDEVFKSFGNFHSTFEQIGELLNKLDSEREKIKQIELQFIAHFDSLKQEFSEIKRTIDIPTLNPDTYITLSNELNKINIDLEEVSRLNTKKVELRSKLKEALADLKKLWYKEYEIVKKEIDKINLSQTSVRLAVDFKGNKDRFKDYLKDALRGTNISDKNISMIVSEYQDLVEVYNDLRIDNSKIKSILSNSDFLPKFIGKFRERASEFLTFRVADKYNIYYKDRPLKDHSLGQRASAVILFILSLKENDLILIDQPEDDLDNQTIYEDVIAELKKLKSKTQFIFATHNPNIPVLGDCEQIFACNFQVDESKSEIRLSSGSIDDLFIQSRIVSIMEGGKEAFNHRKMIYDNWKH
ncbi:TrlF family AAA-like ATPase [Rudanella lutea]|uniref:TrlF family AAA-like ATPase n=1 Tax=Rudanella lutea TaxID=451374 RepID=UPI0003658AFA|nr:hypothetical protein [Rudanella lutea]